MSELAYIPLGLPDRPRNPGNLPFQGFRRNEYASSPPTQGDTTTSAYSRGIYGKWESRSSARSDRDSDSQSDRDSDSGRQFGHQPRRPRQTPEHDGLLGSGSFPRPPGYAAGVSAAKVQMNENSQLSRSSEPYHPPRPYKAAPHSRRDTDAYNDETFGSNECDSELSEDRAQQERRRRASFEMMRKEQHKALQEKQSANSGNNKAGDASDLFEVLGDSKEEKSNHELPVSAATQMSSNDPEKSSLASQAHASRLLVPPGFKSNPLEKSFGLKSLIHPSLSTMGKTASSQRTEYGEHNPIWNANDGLDSQLSEEIVCVGGQPTQRIHSTLLLNKGESMNVHLSFDGPKKTVTEDQLLHISSVLGSHSPLEETNPTELALGDKDVTDSSRSHSTSMLEKISGSSLSTNDGSSSSIELQTSKPEDMQSPISVYSSKFAQWFSEEEAKTVGDVSSTVQNSFLSFIVGGDKANGISNKTCPSNKEDTAPTVLTCEDLEQSILSEYSAKTTDIQPDLTSWSTTGGGLAQTSGHADNHASVHLLSMLQKTNVAVDIKMANKETVPGEHDRATVADNEPQAFPFPIGDNDIYLENGLRRTSHIQHPKLRGAENWLDFGNSSFGISSSKRPAEIETNVGYGLPEQENLISAGNTQDPRTFPLMPSGNSISSNTPINIAEKLAAFGAVTKDKYGMDGSESIPVPHHLFEQRGPDSNMQLRHQSQTPQISQARPLCHHLESTNHQFSSSTIQPSFHDPNVRVSGFDVPSQNSLQHHMQVPGNHTHHLVRSGLGPHHGNLGTGVFHEMNQMQGFPFGPRLQNTGSGNPTDAFQRLIESANSKQIQPLAPAPWNIQP